MDSESSSSEVRLFVSSTFRDLEEERRHLVTDAFPRLRQDCAERGVAFTEINLRWGITDEEARAYEVLRVCLEEIDRCSAYPPFFVGIIGDRYGWIPEDSDWANAQLVDENLPGFSQRHRGKSITELEIQFGVLERAAMHSSAFFFLMEERGHLEPAQQQLRQAIRNSGIAYRDNIQSARELSDWLVHDLTAEVEKRFPKVARPTRAAQILKAQQTHTQNLARVFVGREDLIEVCVSNVMDGTPMCVHGPSGSGKSALLAAVANVIEKSDTALPVFIHHVGAGDARGRVDWMACLFDWARTLNLSELATPGTSAEIQAQLPVLLRALESGGRVVLILDGIDQLDDGQDVDDWMPQVLPGCVSWIVSTTSKTQAAALDRRSWKLSDVPPLGDAIAGDLIKASLGRYRKQLTPAQLNKCVAHPMAATPLFLKVLCEELRVDATHETIEQRVDSLLASRDVPAIFEFMLQRIERTYGTEAVGILSLIGLAKHGVSEPELRAVLGLRPWDVHRVMLMTSPYLSSHQGLISPFHEGLRSALASHPTTARLQQVWYHFWNTSEDWGRRFDEFPNSALAMGAWAAINEWVFAPQTLSHAFASQQVDSPVRWLTELNDRAHPTEKPTHARLSAWNVPALNGLRELAYQVGDLDLEVQALDAQQGCAELNASRWFVERSLLHYRRSQQAIAVQLANRAIGATQSRKDALTARMNLIQMLAFGESPDEALVVKVQ